MTEQRPRERPIGPYAVYLVLEAVRGLGLGLVMIAPIFCIEIAHFGPFELVLAGTVLEVAYFCSEVPTGVLADAYSRKLAVVCGAAVMGGGWLLEGSRPMLWPIMASQVFLGAGWTFFSGASEAWIAGELGVDRASNAIVRAKQANLSATVAGMFGSAALGTLDLRLPILAAGVSHLLLGVFLIVAMRETRRPVRHATRRDAFSSTLRGGVRAIRGNAILVTILLVVFFAGAASEGIDRLWDAHLWITFDLRHVAIGIPRLYVFALVGAGATVLSVVTISYARRFVEHESTRALPATAAVVGAVIAGGTVAFGLAPTLLVAIAMYWAVRIARNVADPVYAVWVVRNAPPELRATVISMEGQSHSIGEIASGPGLGLIGRLVSIPAALVVSGLLQALALPLLGRVAARRDASLSEPTSRATP